MSVKGYVEDFSIWAKGANGQFQMALQRAPETEAMRVYDLICPTIPAQYIVEEFPGLKGLGELQRFTGSRNYVGLDQYENQIENFEYDLGVKINFRDLKADAKNMRKLQDIPAMLAVKAQKVRFKLLVDLLEANGTFLPSGVSLFNDAHFFGDNNRAVTVSSVTAPTIDDIHLVIQEVWSALAGFTDDHGNKLSEITSEDTKLVFLSKAAYANAFRKAQRQLLVPADSPNGTGGGAIDNIYRDTFSYLCSPRFSTSTNVIYVAVVEPRGGQGTVLGKTTPFARTVFTDYSLEVPGQSPDDPIFRNNKQIEIGVYGDEGVGAIDATRILKVTIST